MTPVHSGPDEFEVSGEPRQIEQSQPMPMDTKPEPEFRATSRRAKDCGTLTKILEIWMRSSLPNGYPCFMQPGDLIELANHIGQIPAAREERSRLETML